MTDFQRVFFVTSTIVVSIANLSQAWTNTPNSISHLTASIGCTALSATPAHALALHYSNCDYPEARTTRTIINNALDTELCLQIALQAARDVDQRYGLCTPESACAWQLVDDIYLSSPASRQVEDNVKKVLGREKSIWSLMEQTSYDMNVRVTKRLSVR